MTHSPWPAEERDPDDWSDDAAPCGRDAGSPRGSGAGSTGRRGAVRVLGVAILIAAMAAAGGMALSSRLDMGETTAAAPGSPQTAVNALALAAAKAVADADAAGGLVLAAAGSRLTDSARLPSSGGLEINPVWMFDPSVTAPPRARVATARADAPAGVSLPTRPPEVTLVVPLPQRNPLAGRNLATDSTPPQMTAPQATAPQVATAPVPDSNPLPRGREQVVSARPATAQSDVDASPDGGIALPSPGSRYALYDIEAATVFMPNGEQLEAHSGYGEHFDNARRVHIRMEGPTPPNVYRLSMREALFHGVAAIRLNPVGNGRMYGRTGLLAHTYMLGPRGDSNGCISFKDYPRFLNAFQRGEIAELVVVASSGQRKPASSLLSWLLPQR